MLGKFILFTSGNVVITSTIVLIWLCVNSMHSYLNPVSSNYLLKAGGIDAKDKKASNSPLHNYTRLQLPQRQSSHWLSMMLRLVLLVWLRLVSKDMFWLVKEINYIFICWVSIFWAPDILLRNMDEWCFQWATISFY